MALREIGAFALPVLAVAIASAALEGDALGSQEAWIQIAKQASIIAGIVFTGVGFGLFVGNRSDEDVECENVIATMGIVFALGAYAWAILSRADTKDLRQIFMDKTLHKEAGKAFGKFCVTIIGTYVMLPEAGKT